MKKLSIVLMGVQLLAFSASAEWKEIKKETVKKYILCNSNTGTDGDLISEIRATVTTSTLEWTGSSSAGLKYGERRLSSKLAVPAQGPALFGDVTDYSPLERVSFTATSAEKINIQIEGYRLVLPATVFENNLLGADSNNNDIGVVQCSLNDQSYNAKFK